MKVLLVQDNGGSLRCYGPFENQDDFEDYRASRKNLATKPSLCLGDFILQEIHPLGKVKSSIRKENKEILDLKDELWILKRKNSNADEVVRLAKEVIKLKSIVFRLREDHIGLLSRYEKLAYR